MTQSALRGFAAFLVLALFTVSTAAFPGVYIDKRGDKRVLHATHFIMMQREGGTVVTVMPDYEGPQTPFALVMPVPADVTLEGLRTMKREFLTRMEELTAPRYHEFYEKDPCEPEPAQQEWERDLRVKTTGFLGGNQEIGGQKRAAKEFSIDFSTRFKDSDSEFTFHLIGSPAQPEGDEKKPGQAKPGDKKKDKDAEKETQGHIGKTYPDLAAFLAETGYKMSDEARQSLEKYQAQGQNLLVAEVDPNMIEIGAKERAQLAGIRYFTTSSVTTIPSTLGLANISDKQDLFVYVLNPDKRYEPKNYGYVYPPTNIELEIHLKLAGGKTRVVKERTGEIYNAIHDLMEKQHPGKFLYEYAWSTEGCGQPCPNEHLLVNELLTLGGDAFEELLPEDQRNPEPPPETDEEKKAFEADLKEKELKPADQVKAKKQHAEDRKELARRRAILARHNYVLSRFHYRYDKSNLKKDVEIGAAADHIRGGVALPKGQEPKIDMDVTKVKKPGELSAYQVRFNHYWRWDGQVKCETPERWRWGKRWAHKREWNKVWLGVDLTNRRRDEIDPKVVVRTPLPELGLGMQPTPAPSASAAPGTDGTTTPAKGGCGCRAAGAPTERGSGLALALGLALVGTLGAARVRRRARGR